ncbi:MAG: hypothetical protein NVSMB7_04660 [Chitinophagaceae bacterium]
MQKGKNSIYIFMDHIFYLKLENDVCSAKVTAIDHPYHQLYHVRFDDGYENIFFTDVETGNWIEEDLGETALAGNFGMKVYQLNGPSGQACKALAWCKASVGAKIISFGFYTYMEGNDTVFEVYAANRKFLYLFRNHNSRWQVYDTRQLMGAAEYTEQVKIIISILRGLAGYM